MKHIRERIRMTSVNQMATYHTLMEAYKVLKNSMSEQIKKKWTDKNETKYALRSVTKNDLKNLEKPSTKCNGFTYNGSKLYNRLPCEIRQSRNLNTFKSLIRNWVWENIPSY